MLPAAGVIANAGAVSSKLNSKYDADDDIEPWIVMLAAVALSLAVTTTVLSPSVPGVPDAALIVYLNVLVP